MVLGLPPYTWITSLQNFADIGPPNPSALGGAVIGLNLGYPAVALAGAAMAASGLVLVLLLVRREARVAETAAARC